MQKILIVFLGLFGFAQAQISLPVIFPPNPPILGQGVIKGTVSGNQQDSMDTQVMAVSADQVEEILVKTLVNADGTYALEGLPVGRYYVATMNCFPGRVYGSHITWYGNTNDVTKAILVDITTTNTIVENIDITFHTPQGKIKGRVLDQKGNPVANVHVFAQLRFNLSDSVATNLPFFPMAHQKAQTDENGEYTLDKLIDGEYTVWVWANIGFQYENQYYPNVDERSDSTPIKVENGVANVASVDFNLSIVAGTATISGKVQLQNLATIPYKVYVSINPYYPIVVDTLYIPFDGAGIGMPIRNDVSWGGSFHEAIVNPDGTYTIENVDAGKYIVSAYAYGQGNETDFQYYQNTQDYEKATPIEVSDGAQITGIDFSLNPQNPFGRISGKITDSNGAPVEGVYVNLGGDIDLMMGMPSSLPYYRPFWGGAITDANGEYKIEMVYKGDYTLKAHLNGVSATQSVSVSGDTNTVANFTLNPPVLDAKIRGKVSDDERGSPLFAYVSATDVENGATYFEKTDENGNYEINVPSGKYTLFAWSFYHIGEYYDNTMDATLAKIVETSSNQSVSQIDFTLSAFQFMPPIDSLGNILPELGASGGVPNRSNNTQVLGRVQDNKGNTIEGASVYVYDPNGKAVAFGRTDNNGNYIIENLPVGESFKLHASAAGYDARFSNGSTQMTTAEAISMNNSQIRKDFELSRKSTVAIETENPTNFSLGENYPNPFSTKTQISLSLPKAQNITIKVLDIIGREVLIVENLQLEAGNQKVTLDGSSLGAGTYFYQVVSPMGVLKGKMMVIR